MGDWFWLQGKMGKPTYGVVFNVCKTNLFYARAILHWFSFYSVLKVNLNFTLNIRIQCDNRRIKIITIESFISNEAGKCTPKMKPSDNNSKSICISQYAAKILVNIYIVCFNQCQYLGISFLNSLRIFWISLKLKLILSTPRHPLL